MIETVASTLVSLDKCSNRVDAMRKCSVERPCTECCRALCNLILWAQDYVEKAPN